MNRGLLLSFLLSGTFTTGAVLAQAPPPKPKSPSKNSKAAAANAGTSAWSPDVQQYLGVQEDSFRLVGLNHLSKAQLDALVAAAKTTSPAIPVSTLLTCGPASLLQPEKPAFYSPSPAMTRPVKE